MRIFFLAFIGLILAGTQFAFGGAHLWSASLSQTLIFSLALILLVFRLFQTLGRPRSSPPMDLARPVHPLCLILLLFLLLAFVQTSPPSRFPGWAPPLAEWAGRAAGALLPGEGSTLGALSVNPSETNLFLLWLAAYLVFFLSLPAVLKTRKDIRTVVGILAGMGVFQVLYGVVQTYGAEQKVWWWVQSFQYKGYLTGTYINPNHLAGFLEIALPLCLGAAVSFMSVPEKKRSREIKRIKKTRKRILPGEAHSSLRFALASRLASRPGLYFFLILSGLLGAGLLMTGSRAGILSMCLALFMVGPLLLLKKGYRRVGLASICLPLGLILLSLLGGADRTAARFESFNQDLSQRLEIAASVLPMLRDYSTTGCGLGAFASAYPPFALPEFSRNVTIAHAHNDYLEALVESGPAPFWTAMGLLALFILGGLFRWRKRRDPLAVGLGAGMLAAFFALGLHSLFDFNMRIPANALCLLTAAAVGTSALAVKGSSVQSSSLALPRLRLKPWLSLLIATAVLVPACWLWFKGTDKAITALKAEAAFPTRINSTLNLDPDPPFKNMEQAARLDPMNGAIWFGLAQKRLDQLKASDVDPLRKQAALIRIRRDFHKSLSLEPLNGLRWFSLSRFLAEHGKPEQADAAVEISLALRPNDAGLCFDAALYWLWRRRFKPFTPSDDSNPFLTELNRTLGIPQNPEQAEARFKELFRRAIKTGAEYEFWEQAVDLTWKYTADPDTVIQILPREFEKEKKWTKNKIKAWLKQQDR